MLDADVKTESNDVIDVTQLLPNTKSELVPIEPTPTSARTVPVRSRRCSTAHAHFRLVPPLPTRNGLVANKPSPTPAQPVPFRSRKCSTAHSHYRLVPPLPMRDGLVPNEPSPTPAPRFPVRTLMYPVAYTRLRLIPPPPTIRATTSSEPNSSATENCSTAHTRLRQKPPTPKTGATTDSRPNHSATMKYSVVSRFGLRTPLPMNRSVNHVEPNRSGPIPRQRLLPPSPPPMPSRESPSHPRDSAASDERVHGPIRLSRAVVAKEELPSTSFEIKKEPESQSDDSVESVPPPRPPPCKRRYKRRESSSNQRFPGTREKSMVGKHDVLRYTIPGGKYCYIFLFKRRNHNHDVYRCRECKRMGSLVTIKVIGDDFLSDPCDEPHVCAPTDCLKDKVERVVYKKWREMQQNPRCSSTGSREVWEEMLDVFDDETLGDEEERRRMRLIYQASGYCNGRITTAREALAKAADDAEDSLSEDVEASTFLLAPNREELDHESKFSEQDSFDGSMSLSSSSYLDQLAKKECNEV